MPRKCMEPIRPIPLKPAKQQDIAQAMTPSNLKHSKSSTDVSSLSRTSSFLSFSALESLKSGALSGIFEKGGYETEPPTPDPNINDYKPLVGSASLGQTKAELSKLIAKAAVVGVASFTFLNLFNQIVPTNKFCTISSVQGTDPILYAIGASLISTFFPIIDSHFLESLHISKAPKVSATTKRPSKLGQYGETNETNSSKDWQFNIIVRYFAGFLGLAYAGTKLDFTQSSQFNLCVAGVSACAIVILDRTIHGFILSLVLASLSTAIYMLAARRSIDDVLGIAVLVWLNVCVWGSLGKVFSRR